MKYGGVIYGLLGCWLLWMMLACTPNELYQKDAYLKFSSDTICFDTLFSTIGSTTVWLEVKNPYDEKVLVDRISLKSQGENSPFRISVDGLSGNSYSSQEIPAGGRLYIFVELTVERQDSVSPVSWEDAIVFECGTHSQEVILQAYSQDALIWKGKQFTSDTTLQAGLPYVVYDSLVVAEGVTLSIEEGVGLYFHEGASMMIYGTVKAQGTVDRPIVFRGDRLDDAFEDFPYDNYPGQWSAIYLGENSFDNEFEHVRIRGSYYGIISDSSTCIDRRKLYLNHSVVFNAAYSNLYAVSSNILVVNTLLANSGSYTALLIGGKADFIHCTIANYQSLVARGEEPALALINYTVDAHKQIVWHPLYGAEFTNSIVYGSHLSEIGLGLGEDAEHNFFFRNCLLRSEQKYSEEYATWCLYNISPRFLQTGTDYRYDFRIDSSSVAIAAADTSYTRQYPIDLNGRNRMSDGRADMGAYEFANFIDF